MVQQNSNITVLDQAAPTGAYQNTDYQDPTRYNWQSLWSLVKRYKHRLILANILALLAGLAHIPAPMMIALLVDQVVLEKPGQMLLLLQSLLPDSWENPVVYTFIVLLLALLLRITTYLADLCYTRIFTLVGKQLSADLRQWLFTTLQRQPLELFSSLGSGRVVNHFTTDIETIEKFFSKVLGKLVSSLLLGIGVLSIVFWINWKLMLFMLLVNALVLYVGKRFGRSIREFRKQENAHYGDFQGNLTETLDVLPELRATNFEPRFFERMRGMTKQLCQASIKTGWTSELVSRTSQLCMSAGFDIFRCIAILMVLLSGMSLGEVFAVFAYLWILMGAMNALITAQQEYYNAKASLQRLDEFAAKRVSHITPSRGRKQKTNQNPTGILFDHVSFSFTPSVEVLHNIELQIKPGEKVGLVGHSGSGKSTLLQLILGLQQPNLGKVLIDGEEKTGQSLDVFRSQVALVMQFPALMNETLANNLCLGENIAEAKLWQALKMAQFADDVTAMPNGLETLIGRNGLKLSGGQRQRLALARVFLQNPSLIMLDEATSSLDGETEAQLLANLEPWMEGRTVLMVAHRLSTLASMDRILVLNRGRIAENGSHRQLLKQDGLYSRLVRLAGMYPEPIEALNNTLS